MNHKKITLLPYNPAWPQLFKDEANLIQKILKEHAVAIHHIGSTSVPGLISKPDLDICLVVDHLNNSLELSNLGYIFKGEMNIPMRYYFSKNSDASKVNLHVVESDHHFIKLNLCFRDALRSNDTIRKEYQELKLNILKDPKNCERINGKFPKYTLLKHDFINNILESFGYDSLSVVRCTHYREWDAYHRITKMKGSYQHDNLYDIKNNCIQNIQDHYFVGMHGITIVTVAHAQVLNNDDITIRTLLSDMQFCNHGYDEYMRQFLIKWAKHHHKKII